MRRTVAVAVAMVVVAAVTVAAVAIVAICGWIAIEIRAGGLSCRRGSRLKAR